MESWKVYMIACSDGSLYTGITTDPERRFEQHKSGKGAKYFRGRAPEQFVFLEEGHSRSTASQREAEIKAMNRHQKLALTAEENG